MASLQQKSQSLLIASLVLIFCFALIPCLRAQYPSGPQITKDGTAVLLEDYANAPLSSPPEDTYPAPIDYHEQLGRVNAMVAEPAGAPGASHRFFVIDMNGVLYILDKNSKKFTPYIDFGKLFPKFDAEPPVHTSGVGTIVFDPEYAKNGKFYTVHTENPGRTGSPAPTNAGMPDMDLRGYTVTPAVNAPAGSVTFESVLIEWTDTNIADSKFQGTAREILRIGSNRAIHPMDALLFNPTARPGQSDYRNLYISVGDGSAGELPGPTHTLPQQLNAMQGKVLRITPDVTIRPKDLLSSNGRYRVPSTGPDPNPFISISGARPEVFAYGFRNPQRMTWDPVSDTLLVDDIGLHSWEEVDIVSKGSNYGYAEREGPEQVFVGGPNNGKTGGQIVPPVPFPETDLLTVDGLSQPVVPKYPAAMYSHQDGDSIGTGYVYRGKLMPQMAGKYIFVENTTARLLYADLNEMIASHGVHNKQATVHEIQVMYKNPHDTSETAPVKRRIFDIVADAYAHKEGKANPNSPEGVLPGWANTTGGWKGRNFDPGKKDIEGVQYGGGRADIRLAEDSDGEIYVLSKSDGMIRKLTAVVSAPPAARGATGR